ncbi:hypothetical protein [Variovorax sp. UC122_21]|uniref:hypothetical protein n=1 Tax=Variovorax sp. UC122_21 TaxID=3374554 RepID=UPI0037575DC0
MSSDRGRLSLPSLAQHFDAPEGYVGHFGWICGYSADAPFLNDAAERFTALTKDQRASQGHVALALIVDPGHPPIGFIDAPGIAHLAILEARDKPFRLLHAKVALLGYRHLEQRDRWRLRLVVATGNWTRQTLEDSLDLAWRVEVDSDSLAQPAADDRRACADIGAAQRLLGAIRASFDTRLLDASPSGSEHVQLLDAWMARCAAEAAGEPRFFDNRHASLLSQLPTKVKAESESGARNYLAMGSGFYESGGHPSEAPSVPIAAIRALKEASLLTPGRGGGSLRQPAGVPGGGVLGAGPGRPGRESETRCGPVTAVRRQQCADAARQVPVQREVRQQRPPMQWRLDLPGLGQSHGAGVRERDEPFIGKSRGRRRLRARSPVLACGPGNRGPSGRRRSAADPMDRGLRWFHGPVGRRFLRTARDLAYGAAGGLARVVRDRRWRIPFAARRSAGLRIRLPGADARRHSRRRERWHHPMDGAPPSGRALPVECRWHAEGSGHPRDRRVRTHCGSQADASGGRRGLVAVGGLSAGADRGDRQ